jgi:methyl-accepting chemotaxis protein
LFAPLATLVNLLLIAGAVSVLIVVAVILLYSRYIVSNIGRVNEMARMMSAGDFTGLIEVKSTDEFGQMAHNFNTMTESLKTMLSRVAGHTHHVASTSEELTASAEQTSKATEQIAQAIQEVAGGTDNQLLLVGQLLGEKSKEIGQIVSLITSIAGQTNLLALNAAIEAARAGEHGRGFAVVADEVRKLAEQSAAAAGQISGLISEIQNETTKAVQAMDEGSSAVNDGMMMVDNASNAFQHISQAVNNVFSQIKEVSSSIDGIYQGTQDMVYSMKEITRISESSASNTQHVAAAAEEQTASMEEIAAASATLSRMAEELHDIINQFKV